MGAIKLAVCLLGITQFAFAQSDRGTITGAVVEPAGAVQRMPLSKCATPKPGWLYQVSTSGTGTTSSRFRPARTRFWFGCQGSSSRPGEDRAVLR
jgi:hypothetical protein